MIDKSHAVIDDRLVLAWFVIPVLLAVSKHLRISCVLAPFLFASHTHVIHLCIFFDLSLPGSLPGSLSGFEWLDFGIRIDSIPLRYGSGLGRFLSSHPYPIWGSIARVCDLPSMMTKSKVMIPTRDRFD
jgi:hypothetical protein